MAPTDALTEIRTFAPGASCVGRSIPAWPRCVGRKHFHPERELIRDVGRHPYASSRAERSIATKAFDGDSMQLHEVLDAQVHHDLLRKDLENRGVAVHGFVDGRLSLGPSGRNLVERE
jgi:hypothetical protein